MQSVDGSFLYDVGGAIRPLASINEHTSWMSAWLTLYVASSSLEKLINESVYRFSLRASANNSAALLALLKELIAESEIEENSEKQIGSINAYRLNAALNAFEAVMKAEFGLTPLFLITPKKGFDLWSLILGGVGLFPAELGEKVPESIVDINSGTRCLALEMWTAAAFHFHRAIESVLRKYWETKCPDKPHPGNKTIGDYLTALKRARKGSPKLKGALRDLKDLYRNPVLHPEYSLKDLDEAVALMGSIQAAIVPMLAEIPSTQKAIHVTA